MHCFHLALGCFLLCQKLTAWDTKAHVQPRKRLANAKQRCSALPGFGGIGSDIVGMGSLRSLKKLEDATWIILRRRRGSAVHKNVYLSVTTNDSSHLVLVRRRLTIDSPEQKHWAGVTNRKTGNTSKTEYNKNK